MLFSMSALNEGTTLQNGKYTIVKSLGQGSFGITYLATTKLTMMGKLGQMDTSVNVAIKEFFMSETNSRSKDGSSIEGANGSLFSNYRQKFKKEAENLSKLDHPNIVNVLDVFDENNTTYYVMQYIDGQSLDDYILQQNCIKENEAISILKKIGKAVQYMHSNKMLHLDLKPKNVMLDKDGKIYLIDFGLSKQYDEKGEPESSTKVGAGTPGYAPIEQANYREGKGFPVTMDVYALGATMFKILTGIRPPEASDILNDGFPLHELQRRNVSDGLTTCIVKAMAPIKKDRYQSVVELVEAFKNDEATIVDFEVADYISKKRRDTNVKQFVILPNTGSVRIDYYEPIDDGKYVVFASATGIDIGQFEGSTYISYPLSKGDYEKFLADLQNLKLTIREEKTNNQYESVQLETLSISVYDSQGKQYARYWISGLNNEFGNIVGDICELNKSIKRITPQLQDYFSNLYKEDNSKGKEIDSNFDNWIPVFDANIIDDSITNANLQFEIAASTNVGVKNKDNLCKESCAYRDTPNGTVVVVSKGHCDKGEVASQLVVDSVIRFFMKDISPQLAKYLISQDRVAEEFMVKGSIGFASEALDRYYLEHHESLFASCAVVLIKNNYIYYSAVGDCRIYYYSNKGLSWLTKISYENDKQDVIGYDTIIPPTVSKIQKSPLKDDILLICTDGLSRYLNDLDISGILGIGNKPLSDKCHSLRKLAIQKGCAEDITSIFIRFSDVTLSNEQIYEIKSKSSKSETTKPIHKVFNMGNSCISYRWWAILVLAVEIGFAWLMLTRSRDGNLDSYGKVICTFFFIASICVFFFLLYVKKEIGAKTWRLLSIGFTTACFANSLLLPTWNYSLTGAYFTLSIGLSFISSLTLLIKKSA